MNVSLTVIAGPGLGAVLEFLEPRGFIIGRAEDADYRLPEDDPYVSRRHVYLEVCPPSCRIRDLGATNPPLLNNELIEEADLNHGDILELGYTRFQVTVTGDVAPLPEAHCIKCGRGMEESPDAVALEQCCQCSGARLSEAVQQECEEIACCVFCGADLSEKANSDGRAAELNNIVAYSCENCLPYDDRVAGITIGEFALVRRLGAGGMGVVYLAHHSLTGRLLALKQIRGLKDTTSIKRFERESRIMRSLMHDNIVRCLHTGTHADGPFIVTEFAPDGDVEKLVQDEGGRLAKDRGVRIILQVLDGIGYLHEQQIVHRDIKPQNMLICVTDHGQDKIKLADFGLAKYHSRAGGTRLTQPNSGMGTLMYIPPEQVQDAAGVREPADLYAVGVTLYYLLAGQYTFDFPTPKEVADLQKQQPEEWKSPQEALAWIMRMNRVKHPFQIILNETPVPIRDRNSSIPKQLANVIDKAVRKDPELRYRSAVEFHAALREASK